MNTMLELSMDADYDIFAAFTIVTLVILAKLWTLYVARTEESKGSQGNRLDA